MWTKKDKSHFGSISLGPLIQSPYSGDPAFNNASRTFRISNKRFESFQSFFLSFLMAQNVAQAATAAAAIVGATAADVASAVEHHFAILADPGAPNINVVNAVSLKLPEFNLSRVKYWFLAAKSEFRIKNITADLTKFLYVVSSMKGDVFDQVIDLVRALPQAGAYQGLKDRLLKAFDRRPMEQANAIIDWPG
jgi:hypothetical protein